MELQRGTVGTATVGSVFGCMGIVCSSHAGKPMRSVCEKQDQEPSWGGVPETLRGLGPILSMTEHTGASLAVALGLELRTDSVCFCGSFRCSSFREGEGFLVHVPSGPNLARQGHGHCALTCRHHVRMCSTAATIAAALGHPQASKKCEFFQGTIPGQHCSVHSSA